MLSNRLLYISESSLGSKSANSIQVLSMCTAFVENGFQVDLLCRNSGSKQIQGVKVVEGPPMLILYRFWLLFNILKASFKNEYHIVFGRSYFVQLLVTILGIRSYLEIHTNENLVLLKRVLFYLAKKNNIIFVPISDPLVVDMGLNKYNYVVAHDGHSNQSAFITPLNRRNKRLNVGYFGKLSERKGLDLLRFLDSQDDIDFQMHIFSPDTSEYKWFSDKVEVGFVEHEEILSKMASMDVLLLPIKPVGLRDYSRYTSPLKLFEYASAGRLILLSRVSSLQGLDFPEGIYFCEKESDWLMTLQSIKDRKTYEDRIILENIKKWSSDYTWNKRVKTILAHDFN